MRPRIDDDLRMMLAAGESPHAIARRMDRTLGSCAMSLHRAGRTDLARAFWREAKRGAS